MDTGIPNLNQLAYGNEVSIGTLALALRMLIFLGLTVLRQFRNGYTYWTNFIANIGQVSWTTFVQAGDLSIEVISARFEEIINSFYSGGVSARETLMDVFATILRIFQGALQSTTNLLRESGLLSTKELIQDDTEEIIPVSMVAHVVGNLTNEMAMNEAKEKAKTEEMGKAETEAETEANVDDTTN